MGNKSGKIKAYLLELRDVALDFGLPGVKILLAFFAAITQAIAFAYFYFVADLINAFVEKIRNQKRQDLSEKKQSSIASDVRKTERNYNKLAREQKKYVEKELTRAKSLALLNKLLAESEVREQDLLALARTSSFYQVFVYSVPLTRLIKTLSLSTLTGPPIRMYPSFLHDLGFARLGRASSCFLINKKNLKDKKLQSIKEFKKFLLHHFSRIRDEEWKDFILRVANEDQGKAQRLRGIDYKEKGYLMMNFLLSEVNMNVTNIGLVDGQHLGLAGKKSKEDIYRQILLGPDAVAELDKEDLKVRVKKVINKQDIGILLHGVSQEDRLHIEAEQDSIKEVLNVKSVLGFANVDQDDLARELERTGLGDGEAGSAASVIIMRSQEFQAALDNLMISVDA